MNKTPKIYTLPNNLDMAPASSGPILWEGPANSAEHAASLASKALEGMWVNPSDFEVHDDPADSIEGRKYRAKMKRQESNQ